MYYQNISWKELTKFNKNTPLKKRPIIIIELDDVFNKKYNAIVIKYDKDRNVHVRYLDNPFYDNKYWWTGNKDHLAGLNPISYHAKFLEDDYDEMDGLKKFDFQEDGYDDIINFGKESNRFFECIGDYPYLCGIQGNVHVNNYYISKYNTDLEEDRVPECVAKKANLFFGKRVKVCNSIISNIIEGLPLYYSPLVKEYHHHKDVKKVIKDFKKMLSLRMTNRLMKQIRSETDFTEEELVSIKKNFREGMDNTNLIRLVPYLIGYNIKIFNCEDEEVEIEEYGKNERVIYLMNYKGRCETLI